ncbi:hypothetical protein H8N03_23415 [Ramlibacter sp. USB13]|uniref:Outer membrane lipoprotein carrier protein LolA n=1 Tax=Ramlibacter cellulosilyticus TaxID=2764187 RepID=A0A923SE19_9BURK|nr:hypothetical protein [Ramlibacter cellulosilyticus]MBC5785908.1 hypothetical protein [Ramlibacter cellulosilyticus]
MKYGWRTWIAAAALLAASAAGAVDTRDDESFEESAANLLVVLRESPGANKLEEGLTPFGKISARAADGREFEFEASWFQYLGDMHLRLVFDGKRRVQSAMPDDLQRLRLSPEAALERAVDNLRRRYGTPVAEPWTGGVMQVHGNAPELDSSYFLDRGFWLAQLRDSPAGIVAAVPDRGGLVFARADDESAIATLRFSAAALFASSDATRISSGLYLFKDGRWSVYQPPQKVASD